MEKEGARVVDHGPERTRMGLSDAVKFGEVVGVKSGKETTTLVQSCHLVCGDVYQIRLGGLPHTVLLLLNATR